MFNLARKSTLTGILLAGAVLATSANAQINLESIRVQLPNGQLLSINDGANWQQDRRVAAYKRYYYEPTKRTYVVYNDNDPRFSRYHGHQMHRNAPRPPHGNPHDYNHDDNHGNDHDNGHRGH